MANKDFKVKNKLVIAGLTNANGVLLAENHAVDSHTNLATQYGGTGTTTSPTSGQIPYSASGTTYTPTALNTLDVKGSSYSADAPSNPVVGQIWVESDTTSDSFDPNIIRRKSFTATAAQTVFTTDLEFIQGYEQVFFNGMLLLRNSDYTTASNTNVTLASGAAEGDIVEIVTVTNLNSVNTYTQGEIDTALSAKLSTSTAASTYLTQSNAATTYVPQSNYFVAGKNKIINGDFGIWQRGTTFNNNGGTFCVDRFRISGSGTAPTVSQQTFTPGSAPVSGYEAQYFLRWDQSSAATAAQTFQQRIEDGRTLAGQTATISFWAKANSGTATPDLKIGQNFGSGGSASVTTTVQASISFTGSWVRYSYTVAVPSASGKTIGAGSYLLVYLEFPTSGTWQHDYWGFQMEAGSTATPFQTATGTIHGELAACQRYYWQTTYNPNGATTIMTSAIGILSTAVAQAYCAHPVTMRAIPSASLNGTSNLVFYNGVGGGNTYAITAITAQNSSTTSATMNFTSTGITVNAIYNLIALTGGYGYLAFSSEL